VYDIAIVLVIDAHGEHRSAFRLVIMPG